MLKDRASKHRVNHEAYAAVIKALLDHPQTAHELAEVSGLHIVTSQGLMRVFKRHKIVHVSAWDPDSLGRDVTPVFSLGKGRNVARRKKTPAERTAAYRARQQAKLLTLRASA